eukprot:1264926-Amphidinium_carterae.1
MSLSFTICICMRRRRSGSAGRTVKRGSGVCCAGGVTSCHVTPWFCPVPPNSNGWFLRIMTPPTS